MRVERRDRKEGQGLQDRPAPRQSFPEASVLPGMHPRFRSAYCLQRCSGSCGWSERSGDTAAGGDGLEKQSCFVERALLGGPGILGSSLPPPWTTTVRVLSLSGSSFPVCKFRGTELEKIMSS